MQILPGPFPMSRPPAHHSWPVLLFLASWGLVCPQRSLCPAWSQAVRVKKKRVENDVREQKRIEESSTIVEAERVCVVLFVCMCWGVRSRSGVAE